MRGANKKDLNGQQFGSWTVTGTSPRKAKNGGLYWTVKCVCGSSSMVASTTLISGKSTQCWVCSKKGTRKRYCVRGHDTHKWGRTSSQTCRACLRDKAMRTNYGISLEEYIEIYKFQKGKCAICFRPFGSYLPKGEGFGNASIIEVDHDHSKKGRDSVRGLLCGRDWKGCNRKLGQITTVEWLKNTLAYLENPPAQTYIGAKKINKKKKGKPKSARRSAGSSTREIVRKDDAKRPGSLDIIAKFNAARSQRKPPVSIQGNSPEGARA